MEQRLTYQDTECYVHKHTAYGVEVRPLDLDSDWCVYLDEEVVKRLLAEHKAEGMPTGGADATS